MQKDNEIRTLRAQQKQKELVLKRKQEEVSDGPCSARIIERLGQRVNEMRELSPLGVCLF